jgi:hypothetical protein
MISDTDVTSVMTIHPPAEDLATNEVEVLDPVVDDQLQLQFYEMVNCTRQVLLL